MSELSAVLPNLQPVPAVGIVCLRADQVLLIKRATPPRQGEWSIPGGRVALGEAVRDAAQRELREETGIKASIGPIIDVVDAVFRDAAGEVCYHYVLTDFLAEWVRGEPVAGDDASEARFVRLDELAQYDLWHETQRVIELGVRRRKPNVFEDS